MQIYPKGYTNHQHPNAEAIEMNMRYIKAYFNDGRAIVPYNAQRAVTPSPGLVTASEFIINLIWKEKLAKEYHLDPAPLYSSRCNYRIIFNYLGNITRDMPIAKKSTYAAMVLSLVHQGALDLGQKNWTHIPATKEVSLVDETRIYAFNRYSVRVEVRVTAVFNLNI